MIRLVDLLCEFVDGVAENFDFRLRLVGSSDNFRYDLHGDNGVTVVDVRKELVHLHRIIAGYVDATPRTDVP